MPKQNKKTEKQKTTDQYRRDIFILKNKIKQQQHYLQEIKQKCSQVDIFTQQSYTFQMKIKILQNDFATIREKIYKYSRDTYSKYYELNFCVYALSRACQIVGLTPEMVYRCIDVQNKKIVTFQAFSNYLRQVLRMDSSLSNPILESLDIKQNGNIEFARYIKLLRCFMIDLQKQANDKEKQKNQINEAVDRVCLQLLRMQCILQTIWDQKFVNIASTIGGIKKKLPKIDTLDCAAVYCRCDPNKQGAIQSEKVVSMLEKQKNQIRKFRPTVSSTTKVKLKQT